jgi:hypothetical protein
MSPRQPKCRNLLNDFSLFPGRVHGACDADQTGGDGDGDACDRKPFTFLNLQIGVPYRIDETQPCDENGRDRDPKCLDFCKARGQSHSRSLRALCVEMVASRPCRQGHAQVARARGGRWIPAEKFRAGYGGLVHVGSRDLNRCHSCICSQTDFQNKKFTKEVIQNVRKRKCTR